MTAEFGPLDLSRNPSLTRVFEAGKRLSRLMQAWLGVVGPAGPAAVSQVALNTATIMLTSAVKSHRSVLLLSSYGYREDALSVLRNLNQAGLELEYIARNPDKLAARRLDYSVVQWYEDLLEYGVFSEDEMAGRVATDPALSSLLSQVRQEADRVQVTWGFWGEHKDGIYRRARGWAGIGVGKMAKDVGATFDYRFVYRRASHLVHGAPISSPSHFEVNGKGFLVPKLAPTDAEINVIVHWANKILIQIAKRWASFWDFPPVVMTALSASAEEVDQIEADWRTLFHSGL